jgi:pyruvate dehydrogenase E2 component (dihydrolipoamide acetyltransferase)
MADFLMPILGADMTEGKVVSWLKHPGDRIERGEIIVEIETDKANVEVECYTPGTLEQLLVAEDEAVAVGTPLARIKADVEEKPPATTIKPGPLAPTAPTAPAAPTSQGPTRAPSVEHGERQRVSPAARQLAEQLGVDFAGVTGTGPGGRITREDVEAAATSRTTAVPAPPIQDKQARMRQAIAAAMVRSAREIPHFHLMREIDMSAALVWLTAENGKRPVTERLLYAVLLVKAVALALRETPDLNGEWVDGRVLQKPEINLGMAISLRGGGLVAPALLKADGRTLDDLMASFRDLVQRARAGKLRASELTESTVTITNLGELGADAVYGVIYPNQAALVGFGRVTERATVNDGALVAQPVITATLSADHRVVDGHLGSAFLTALDGLLQVPEKL